MQFYLEQMYDSNQFNKNDMLVWEKQPTATKTNYNLAKTYFKELVKATNTYEQNARGGRGMGRRGYESANQMADHGDKICEYIAKITSTAAVANTVNKEAMEMMAAEIRALSKIVAQLATKVGQGRGPKNNENKKPQQRRWRSRGQAHKPQRNATWESTATPTATIQLKLTITAPHANGRKGSTRAKPTGTID